MSVLVSNGNGNCATFIEAVVEEVMADVTGCDVKVAEMQTFNAFQEFCRRGYCLIERGLGPYTIRAGSPEIYLDPVSEDINVAYVFRAFDEGRPLTPAAYNNISLAQQAQTNSAPGSYDCPQPGLLRVWPVSSVQKDNAITVDAALVPVDVKVNLPAHFFTHYKEGIKAGAEERLLRTPDRPYTSPVMAGVAARIFNNSWRSARSSALAGFSIESTSGWRFPRGWANTQDRR